MSKDMTVKLVLDIIAESPEEPTTRTPYSNEGTNDPYYSDPF